LEEILYLRDFYFDLQLFASPEDEGRTEEPTERKRKKAREEGNVAKSQDLVSALVFLFSFWVLWLMSKIIFVSIRDFMVNTFQSLNAPLTLSNVGYYIVQFSAEFWKIVGPAILAGVFTGILSNVFQVGFMFSSKAITPKFNKIAFTPKKLKEKFFSKSSFTNLLFSLVKFGALSLIFIIIIKSSVSTLVNMGGMGLEQSLGILGDMALKLFNAAGVFLVALGIPDYIVKKKQFEDSLKMKKEETKREFKEDEGDPLIKGRMQEMYRELLNAQNIRKTVPEADVVITNPTHFAVALKYELQSMPSPMVVAKGEDKQALLIREIAGENGIPIEENPPLARQLYAVSEVGDYIPDDFFMVIAELYLQIGKFQQNIA
jgi:flagellar biosynthetic protein FlhB